jgi:hypothetical protein
MEAELQRQKVLVAAHIKERDMYRSMLARQGVDVDLSNSHPHVSSPGSIKGDAGAAQVLQEQQALFESMTAEMGIDTQRLKHDLTSAQRERDQNIVAVSKANAQIEYLQGTNHSSSSYFLIPNLVDYRAHPSITNSHRPPSSRARRSSEAKPVTPRCLEQGRDSILPCFGGTTGSTNGH